MVKTNRFKLDSLFGLWFSDEAREFSMEARGLVNADFRTLVRDLERAYDEGKGEKLALVDAILLSYENGEELPPWVLRTIVSKFLPRRLRTPHERRNEAWWLERQRFRREGKLDTDAYNFIKENVAAEIGTIQKACDMFEERITNYYPHHWEFGV